MVRDTNPYYNIGPGDFIKEELDVRGWLQKELAELLNMSEKHITNIIKNKLNCSNKYFLYPQNHTLSMNLKTLKQFINNIRGAEMALTTVITIVLLIIVLIVAASFFLGGADVGTTPIMDIGKEAAGQAQRTNTLDWLS